MQRNRPIHDVVQQRSPEGRGGGGGTVTKCGGNETEGRNRVAGGRGSSVNAQVVSRVVRPEDAETTAATDDGFITTLIVHEIPSSSHGGNLEEDDKHPSF